MNCMNNPAVRRYLWRFLATMLLYIAFLVLAVWIFVHYHPAGPLAWLLAFLPALGIIAQIAAFGMYLSEEKDEFMRTVQMQSMVGGIGATLAATTIWGYMEKYVHAPHLDLIWLYLIFWGFAGISYGVVKLRYR